MIELGTRGPRAKPNEIKLLEGNPGKREINNHPICELTDDCREPPPHLGRYAKKEWKRILPLLEKNGLVTDLDYTTLASYCQAVDTWILAEQEKRKYGFTITTDKGNVIQHPAVGIANSALQNILKFCREFGLSPSSRTALSIDNVKKSDNPVLSLIAKREKIQNA